MSIQPDERGWALVDESATLKLGRRIASAITQAPLLIALDGDLGAGKTTLVRGLLRGLGYTAKVVSPTYTLMETYLVRGLSIVHMDLYRISHPEELEFLGLRDRLGDSIVLVEWPRKGERWLPAADLRIGLELSGSGRKASMQAFSATGRLLLTRIEAAELV